MLLSTMRAETVTPAIASPPVARTFPVSMVLTRGVCWAAVDRAGQENTSTKAADRAVANHRLDQLFTTPPRDRSFLDIAVFSGGRVIGKRFEIDQDIVHFALRQRVFKCGRLCVAFPDMLAHLGIT